MATVATSFFDSVKMIAAEKSINEEDVFSAVEESLAKAADKYFNSQDFYGNFQAQMDRETGEFHVYALKQVVPVVEEEGKLVGVLSRAVVQRRLAEDEPPEPDSDPGSVVL